MIDERDALKTVNLCVMTESIKEGQSFRDKINEWRTDIYNFAHKC